MYKEIIKLKVTPVAKPRMTKRDVWKRRECVLKYRTFCDEVRKALCGTGVGIPESGAHFLFVMPMPKSWSKKKQAAMWGQQHTSRPDKDNLEKALLDAVFKEDSGVWDARATKIWGDTGMIVVGIDERDAMDSVVNLLTEGMN